VQPDSRLKSGGGSHAASRLAQQDPALVRWLLILTCVGVMGLLVVLPVVAVFVEAFRKGLTGFWENIIERDTLHSIGLTLFVAPVAVVFNVVTGLAAAWAISRFQFRGRALLTTMIDLPFAVSPVVVGLSFMLLFGQQGFAGPWLKSHGIEIVFNVAGIILATMFVTLPFVARELIPVMEAIGSDEEVAAVSLGANGWQIFWRITLPNIKWGLLYGVILCNARAMGEYGAVAVVSGRIEGKTQTMPLRIEYLEQNFNTVGAFAVASLLTLLAIGTLVLKVWVERLTRQEIQEAVRAADTGGAH
jgi:sulfate/thiosulfate transport system permease protein